MLSVYLWNQVSSQRPSRWNRRYISSSVQPIHRHLYGLWYIAYWASFDHLGNIVNIANAVVNICIAIVLGSKATLSTRMITIQIIIID